MSIQAFLANFLNKFTVKPVIDPKIVNYVVGIMNGKNAELKKTAFTTVFIMKLSELFINVPNAVALKNLTPHKYLYFTSTSLDILEHSVLSEDDHDYTLTCVDPNSPYTMKVVFGKARAESMMRSIIEHELGHLYFDNHCRLYAPKILFKTILSLVVAGIGIYKHICVPLVSLPTVWGYEINWPLLLVAGGAYYTYLNACMFFNSSFIDSSKWEQEADEFITSDSRILQGGILFQEIALKAQMYIYSYSNWWVRLHARLKGMDCAEFVKNNREKAHTYFERSSSMGDACHPLHETRIARFNERIEALKNSENYIEAEKESATITIYRGTQVIEKFIL